MLRKLRWAILWALIILWLCLIPGASLPQWHWFDIFNLDKSVHAFMFFTLAVLLASALMKADGSSRFITWSALISVVYGLGTEWMQGLEALGRRTDINDAIANSVGALLAAAYVNWKVKKSRPIVPFAFLR